MSVIIVTNVLKFLPNSWNNTKPNIINIGRRLYDVHILRTLRSYLNVRKKGGSRLSIMYWRFSNYMKYCNLRRPVSIVIIL